MEAYYLGMDWDYGKAC